MAQKTLIGGTAYEISGGKTLVGGTAYSIDKGKTLVGGTAYEIPFVQPCKLTSSIFYSTRWAIYLNGWSLTGSSDIVTEGGGLYSITVNAGDIITVKAQYWPNTCKGVTFTHNGTTVVSLPGNSWSFDYNDYVINPNDGSVVWAEYSFTVEGDCSITGGISGMDLETITCTITG